MSNYRGILITSLFLSLLLLIYLFSSFQLKTIELSCEKSIIINEYEYNLCPVSSALRVSHDKYAISYPIDIFDPIHERNVQAQDIWNCTSSEIQSMKVFHQCSRFSRCPLSLANINTAKNRSSSWKAKHSLCYWNDNYSQKNGNVSNIIILGGSVTKGAGASDCCCDGRIEPKCRPFDYNAWMRKGCGPLEASYCRWSTLLINWMKQTFKNKNIREVFLAQGGATSPFMAEQFAYQLGLQGIHELTANDIVFIDHSVNDGMVYDSKIRNEQLRQGLESLILRILHVSRTHSWPTIILLEMWPYHSPIMNLENRPVLQGSGVDPFDYRFVYENIAKEYQIPIWSYRDVVWSYEADNFVNPTNSKMVEYLRFLHNPSFAYQHPPWFIHLYYADLITGILRNELKKCNTYRETNTRDVLLMNLSALVTDPAHHIVETEFCLNDVQSLLDQSSDLQYHGLQPAYYNVSPASSWKLLPEHSEKYGWIDQNRIQQNTVCKNHGKYSSILAFHFDSSPMAYSGSLFQLNCIPSNNHLYCPIIEDRPNDKKFLVSLHYMRTYLNAGTV